LLCTARRKSSRRWVGRFWKVGRAVGSIAKCNNKIFYAEIAAGSYSDTGSCQNKFYIYCDVPAHQICMERYIGTMGLAVELTPGILVPDGISTIFEVGRAFKTA
jgi:hypothetical protein